MHTKRWSGPGLNIYIFALNFADLRVSPAARTTEDFFLRKKKKLTNEMSLPSHKHVTFSCTGHSPQLEKEC